jgi:hypothetical protein
MADDGDDLEQKIRERAYALWQQAGSPEGRHEEFWHQARDEQSRSGSTPGDQNRTLSDETGKESFPASDPPANPGIVGPEAKSEHAVESMKSKT